MKILVQAQPTNTISARGNCCNGVVIGSGAM